MLPLFAVLCVCGVWIVIHFTDYFSQYTDLSKTEHLHLTMWMICQILS